MLKSISHGRVDESMAAKARWVQTLSEIRFPPLLIRLSPVLLLAMFVTSGARLANGPAHQVLRSRFRPPAELARSNIPELRDALFRFAGTTVAATAPADRGETTASMPAPSPVRSTALLRHDNPNQVLSPLSTPPSTTHSILLPYIPFDTSTSRPPALSGSLSGVTVQGDMAYLRFGDALLALDVSQSQQPVEVGRASLAACPGGSGALVARADRLVVLCFDERQDPGRGTVNAALLVFRIAPRSAPVPLAVAELREATLDLAVLGSYTFLTTVDVDSMGWREGLTSFNVDQFPLSLPDYLDVGLVGLRLATAERTGAIFGYGFNKQALQFLDLADPASPRLAGRLDLAELDDPRPTSLALVDDIAYLTGPGDFLVADGRDIHHPVLVFTEVPDLDDCEGSVIAGNERLVVLTTGCPSGGGALYVMDPWRPPGPARAASGPLVRGSVPITTNWFAEERVQPIAIDGNRVFVADRGDAAAGSPSSFTIIDITEPSAPRILSRMTFARR